VHTLAQLITVYIWLRVTTSVMTVLAGWKLRQARPEMLRVFRIPWGQPPPAVQAERKLGGLAAKHLPIPAAVLR